MFFFNLVYSADQKDKEEIINLLCNKKIVKVFLQMIHSPSVPLKSELLDLLRIFLEYGQLQMINHFDEFEISEEIEKLTNSRNDSIAKKAFSLMNDFLCKRERMDVNLDIEVHVFK